MDRGAWWATIHWVAESDVSERLTLSLSITIVKDIYQFSQSIVRQKIKDDYNYKP